MFAILGALTLVANHFPGLSRTPHRSYFGAGSCAALRAAGLSSIHAGHPAYRPWLDADHDGIACEPWSPRASQHWRSYR